ncbi:hypothetical protein [Pseudoteredinibacter isoporae]|uniref:Uncharacterized protein n=1 Tax=Pseudoteredinibacter isoporae TaxID=570281 RepID=A0A7X0JUR1_9GAMM|nr:hypothetical protein [Pseudoteredinibacter isoporae]MBB6521741.1 hypothetical protein [Pseudoteredinibacter isoporae]NHO87289.1 hypothetical protein [Pseudoteredinibacter isoporae]NIB23079.1 hypothetical protein [Pseudoteredinibacter isoporae]
MIHAPPLFKIHAQAPIDISGELNVDHSVSGKNLDINYSPKSKVYEGKPRVVVAGRIAFIANPEGEFSWGVKASIGAGVGARIRYQFGGLVDEKFVNDHLGPRVVSHSKILKKQADYSLVGLGKIDGKLNLNSKIGVRVWGVGSLTLGPDLEVFKNIDVETVPEYALFRDYYGSNRFQLKEFSSGVKGFLGYKAKVKFPFIDELPISDRFELSKVNFYKLPQLDVGVDNKCTDIKYSLDGKIEENSIGWVGLTGGRKIRFGPSGSRHWTFPADSTITHVMASAYGELGPVSKRHIVRNVVPQEGNFVYVADAWGTRYQAKTPDALCRKIGAAEISDEWVLMSTGDWACYWAFGGSPDDDLDGRVYYGRERVCL